MASSTSSRVVEGISQQHSPTSSNPIEISEVPNEQPRKIKRTSDRWIGEICLQVLLYSIGREF